MPTATVPVSIAVPATATVPVSTTAVPRLDRASDRNRQRGCSNDEQLGCTCHRGLSVKVIRTATREHQLAFQNCEPYSPDAGESKKRQNSV
jgi:hypothetical protein